MPSPLLGSTASLWNVSLPYEHVLLTTSRPLPVAPSHIAPRWAMIVWVVGSNRLLFRPKLARSY